MSILFYERESAAQAHESSQREEHSAATPAAPMLAEPVSNYVQSTKKLHSRVQPAVPALGAARPSLWAKGRN